MKHLILLFLILLNTLDFIASNDVLGCGGFINSHVPLDFSKVEIKLLTKKGILKDKTNCAPNNGYYFLPLYDKGEYVLKLEPPPGWSFSPTEVSLNVDGATDLCSLGKDINFVFQGFGITGKVESFGSSKGPIGVSVELQSQDDKRHTITSKDGIFFFTPVYPGEYKVTISHPRWKAFKESVSVVVKQGNTDLPPKSLIIQGYTVKGRVVNDGEPVENAFILLFSKENKQNLPVSGCLTDHLPEEFSVKPICYVKTDKKGFFTFGTIPLGKYQVTPHTGNQNVYFQPNFIEFDVGHDDVDISETFQVVGFSVGGSVLKSTNGKPLSGAKIFMNGKEVAKSDAKGLFRLEKLKAGIHIIRVEADDYKFEETALNLSPNIEEISPLIPSMYKVCGTVLSEKQETVIIKNMGTGNSYKTLTAPNSGTFCEFLTPASYQIHVEISEKVRSKGIQFFPFTQIIHVSKEVIEGIMFSQLKAVVKGRVRCIQKKDCVDLKVSLRSLSEDSTSDRNEIMIPVKDGSYTVNNVFPGNYEVTVYSHKLCWKTNKQVIAVNSEEVIIPDFEQSGYSVLFVSSHDTEISFVDHGQKPTSLKINKGRTHQCVTKPGKHKFNLSGCHTFESDIVEFDTDSEVSEIFLNALKHKVKLSIAADKSYGELYVAITASGSKKLIGPLLYMNNGYNLEFSLAPGDTIVVIPQSEVLYFNPPLLSVTGSDDCQDLGPKFIAKKGKFFAGKVSPPLEGVLVTVESDDIDPLIAETDKNGYYKFQPLDDSKKYKLTAKKDNYVLTGPDNEGNFVAHKLAEVVVEVIDEMDKSPLQGTLLSLSGGQSYRSNLQTSEDGKITFHSLSPNQYFLKPMMKEYRFNPESKIIDVKEGETFKVQLVGKRIAYSAYGSITSLNGEPEERVIVVAQGIDNCSHYSEESTTDSSGNYRIRGLQPSCTYNVKVKGVVGDSYVIERSAPGVIHIDNVHDDIKNLKMIVFRPVTNMDILVKVYAENPEHYKSIKVKLFRESEPSGLIHLAKIDTLATKVANPGVLVYLPSVLKDGKSYSLQLDSNLPNKGNLPVEYFNADAGFKYFSFDFVVKSHVIEQQIKQTSIWAVVVVLVLTVIVYNIDKILDFVKDRLGNAGNINILNLRQSNKNNFPVDNTDIDQIVESINAVKRKNKPKRI